MKSLIAIVLLFFAVVAYADEPAILQGKWKFNAKESDDPAKKFQEALKRNNGGFGPEGPYGNRTSSFPRSGGPGGRDHDHNFLQPPEWIEVTYSAPQFRIIDNSGEERDYFTDGRKTEKEIRGGRKITYTAVWSDDSLIVNSQGREGGKMTETYYLSPDRQRLYIKRQFQPIMLDSPIMIVSAFDKVTEEAQTQTQNN